MAFAKVSGLVVLCCLVAVQTQVVPFHGAKGTDAEYDPNPQYAYQYSVADPITGDSKSQHESRSGDVVQGSYSLVEADGSVRTVEYTADPASGFNAVVSNSVTGVAASPAVKSAPVAAYKPYAATVGAYPYSAYHAAPYSGYHAAPYSGYHAAPYSAYHVAPYSGYHAAPYSAYHATPYSAYHVSPYHATPYHAKPYSAFRHY